MIYRVLTSSILHVVFGGKVEIGRITKNSSLAVDRSKEVCIANLILNMGGTGTIFSFPFIFYRK